MYHAIRYNITLEIQLGSAVIARNKLLRGQVCSTVVHVEGDTANLFGAVAKRMGLLAILRACPPPCTPGQPAVVQNCSGQFCHFIGRMPKRTSAEPRARRAQGGTPGVNRVGSSTHHIRQIRKTPHGALAYLAERVGFEPTLRHNRKPDFESGAFDHSATSPEICRRHGASRSPAHCSPRPWDSPFALRAQGQLRCPRSFQTNGSATLPRLQKCPPAAV